MQTKEEKAEYCRGYYQRNAERLKAATRRRHAQVGYRGSNRWAALGLSIEDAQLLLANGCKICGRKDGKLCIDHDHSTMKVRGVLCSTHNLAISLFGDSSFLLTNAARYVAEART